MNFNNLIFTLSQTSDIDQPSLFPFPFSMHVFFAVLSLVFFVYRFVTDKRPYQLIFAVAIPLSLAIWISDGRALFYAIGAIELVLLIAALVTAVVIKRAPEEKQPKTGDDGGESELNTDAAEPEQTEVQSHETDADESAETDEDEKEEAQE